MCITDISTFPPHSARSPSSVHGVSAGSLKRTLDALAVLDRVRGDIDGFEVINGTMDDVFLNAAGKRLETGEDRA